jgi:hypothetical protein
MSYLEISSGVALFAGPGIGSLFYIIGEHTAIGGYSCPFYFLTLIILLIYPFVMQLEISPAD